MKYFLIYFFIISCIFSSIAEIKLPAVFSDGMVLQREKPIHIWGKVKPNAKVSIRFAGIVKNTIAESDGTFVIKLKSLSASKKPRTIYIKSGNDEIEIKNVVVGEVWLCSGQSNMEWKVNQSANYEVEKKSANYPLVRMITVKNNILPLYFSL